jgi:hypothetical protein
MVYEEVGTLRKYIIFYVYSSLMFLYTESLDCEVTLRDRLLERTKSIKIYGKPGSDPWSTAGLVSFTKNKKIDNTCMAIDCAGIEKYCNTLEDC